MPHRARAGFLLTTFVLAACGGGDASEAGSPPAEGSAPEGAQTERASPNSPINAFTFSPSGAEPAAELPTAADLTLLGGCAAPSRMSIGFLRGTPLDDTYFNFAIESPEPVAPGHTGEVELSSVVWDNGVTTPPNLPADSPIRGPNRLQGTGVLTIRSHTGRGMGGHMVGVVEATLTDDAGNSVPLEASFDINLACAG